MKFAATTIFINNVQLPWHHYVTAKETLCLTKGITAVRHTMAETAFWTKIRENKKGFSRACWNLQVFFIAASKSLYWCVDKPRQPALRATAKKKGGGGGSLSWKKQTLRETKPRQKTDTRTTVVREIEQTKRDYLVDHIRKECSCCSLILKKGTLRRYGIHGKGLTKVRHTTVLYTERAHRHNGWSVYSCRFTICVFQKINKINIKYQRNWTHDRHNRCKQANK